MTFEDALAQQPTWLGIWLNILLFGAFILPIALFIWRETRITAIITLLASGCAAMAIIRLYGEMGYVRLLGLPHVIIWTPLVVYLIAKSLHASTGVWPRRVLWAISATILVSLAFDYVDVLRYMLGDRMPTILPPSAL